MSTDFFGLEKFRNTPWSRVRGKLRLHLHLRLALAKGLPFGPDLTLASESARVDLKKCPFHVRTRAVKPPTVLSLEWN